MTVHSPEFHRVVGGFAREERADCDFYFRDSDATPFFLMHFRVSLYDGPLVE